VAQIVRVENMHLTAHLDEGSVAQVQETNRKAIEQESDVLAQHMKKLKEECWNKQYLVRLTMLC
jgi:hypothetical protein